MDKIRKEVDKRMSMDQKDPDVHRYIVDNGIVKIKLHLEQLKKETLELKYEKKDWKRREKILRETIESVNVLHYILKNTTDDALIRFRQCEEVFPLVFEIGKATCAITCMISTHLAKRFSPENRKLCCGVLKIPEIFDDVLAYLTPEKPTDLSDGASIEGILKEAIIFCRAKLHMDCIDFNIYVSKQVRTVLKIMGLSKFRTQEGFKPFLSSVVEQFLFVQRACGLTREILKCTSDEDWASNSFEYKKMFKCIKWLLSYGVRALRSLGFDEKTLYDFYSVDIVCKQIRQCNEKLTSDINLESFSKLPSATCIVVNPATKQKEKGKISSAPFRHLESGTKTSITLNPLLKEIEIVCFKIDKTIKEVGAKCLPPGEIQIEEDVSVRFSSDSEEVVQDNNENEKSSDFIEKPVVDSDDNEVNDTDFEGTLTKISPEEIEEILKSSDMDRGELIQTFKMDGIKSPVDVLVDNRSTLTCQSVGGKVFSGSSWKSTKHVVVKGRQISMQIEPGEFLVVHYVFPIYEKTFSREEVKRGVAMSIPEAHCSIKLPPSDGGRETIKFKVHLTDKERIKKYQEENPNKYGNITVSEGLQARAISRKVTVGTVEFPEVDEPESSLFVCMSTDTQFKNWDRDIVEPETKRGKMIFNVMLKKDVISYIVQVKDQNWKQSIKDHPEEKLSFLKKIQNAFHTLLGLKSKCKLLTLYKVPEEIGDTIELCVFCIESKGFDLSKQAKIFLENKWMQIEDGDESSDFTIRSGEEIGLEFNGNVKPKEGQNPVIKFLKNGSNFAHLQLHLVDSKNPRGYILMVRKDILIDWKILNWDYLVKKYEAENTIVKMDENREEVYKATYNNLQHVVNAIFKQLSDNEIEQMKKELKMTAQKTKVQFMDRFIGRIQGQKKLPLEFLAGELRKIGRDDLFWNQLESRSS